MPQDDCMTWRCSVSAWGASVVVAETNWNENFWSRFVLMRSSSRWERTICVIRSWLEIRVFMLPSFSYSWTSSEEDPIFIFASTLWSSVMQVYLNWNQTWLLVKKFLYSKTLPRESVIRGKQLMVVSEGFWLATAWWCSHSSGSFLPLTCK